MIGLDPDTRSGSLFLLQMLCIRYLCIGSYNTKEKMAFSSVDSDLCCKSADRAGTSAPSFLYVVFHAHWQSFLFVEGCRLYDRIFIIRAPRSDCATFIRAAGLQACLLEMLRKLVESAVPVDSHATRSENYMCDSKLGIHVRP